jgi:hypothetical protein
VKETKAETPTRTSARIAAKALSEGFSDDETEKVFVITAVLYFHLVYLRRFFSAYCIQFFRLSVCFAFFKWINGKGGFHSVGEFIEKIHGWL